MEKLLDKLSAYNIFTNLFPGIIYCFVATKLFDFPLIQDDLVIAAFLYYFCGMVISRVGSVVIEPIMIKSGFVSYANYNDYVAASKSDKLIEELLVTSNAYRSVVSFVICLLATGAWGAALSKWPSFQSIDQYLLLGSLLVLFGFSFRKQTNYISKRVAIHKEGSGETE